MTSEQFYILLMSSSCDLIRIRRFVGQWTQNGRAFILHNHEVPQEWAALRRDLVVAVTTVCDAGRCCGITYHLSRSDIVHLGGNWVVLKLSQLCNHSSRLPMPSSGKSTRNWCHRLENTSLFALRCFQLYQRGFSTGKLKIYTIHGSKYCATNVCNNMLITPWRHKHTSSGAIRPSDVAVSVNINAEFNLRFIWWQLSP